MLYIVFWKDGKKEKVEANSRSDIEENSLHKKKNPDVEMDFSAHTNFKDYTSSSFNNFTYYPQEKKWWWA